MSNNLSRSLLKPGQRFSAIYEMNNAPTWSCARFLPVTSEFINERRGFPLKKTMRQTPSDQVLANGATTSSKAALIALVFLRLFAAPEL